MSDPFVPKIESLIEDQDTIEIIRDEIGAIIKGETASQYALAVAAGKSDKNDYNLRVFLENARPYDTSAKPLLPVVNISLSKTTAPDSNARLGPQRETGIVYIDCFAFGNDTGEHHDDRTASRRAWKIARIVRRIMMSDAYTYLGLQGVVGSRLVTERQIAVPNMDDQAVAVAVVRITLQVGYREKTIVQSGPIIEQIGFDVDPDTGEVTI